PGLYPTLDSIGAVPPSVQNRDEARVPDGAGPIDTLPLQVAPVIKHAGVSINTRPVQLHHDFHAIAGTEIQRVEQRALLRAIQKLRETCPAAERLRVYSLQFHVQINAHAAPLWGLRDLPYDASGGITRVWRNCGMNRRGPRTQEGNGYEPAPAFSERDENCEW